MLKNSDSTSQNKWPYCSMIYTIQANLDLTNPNLSSKSKKQEQTKMSYLSEFAS